MLDNLTRRLSTILAGISRKGRLSEDDVNEMLREVRVALLEADVNFKVAKDFIARVKERSIGENIFGTLTADQTIIKIVRDELVEMLGSEQRRFMYGSQPPAVVLLCGLQGSGKTTTCAKLAKWLQGQGKKPMLAACDVQRPAAITQLEVLGDQVGVPVYSRHDGASPVTIAKEALARAKHMLNDVLIVDTAGRLQIDEALMAELRQVYDAVNPDETLLVVDSTTGQEAVNVAEAFHREVPLTGAIFTKLDGDTRGGAILSVRAATGVPVRFIGVGEQTEALEQFYPDRTAERILGMGDVLGIIEKAEKAFEGEDVGSMERAMKSGEFDFNLMLDQFRMMRRMGPLKNVLKMVPGAAGMLPEDALDKISDKDVNRIEAIILSMTPKERTNPDIINGSRRKRMAAGSGTSVEEVNHLIKQLYEMRRTMKTLTKMQRQFGKRNKRR
jgi:signal recognition particle subunit SRP54